MTNSNPAQNARVVKYIKDFGGITQIEALRDLGVMRLASRISDLRKRGYPISSDWIEVTNRYGEKCRVKKYFLGGEPNNGEETRSDDLLRDRKGNQGA